MSYCRFGWDGSDVYLYQSIEGYECCGCSLKDYWTYDTPEDLLNHLMEHKKVGDFIPMYAITSLWEDIEGPNEPFSIEPFFAYNGRMMRCMQECIEAGHPQPSRKCAHTEEVRKLNRLIAEL